MKRLPAAVALLTLLASTAASASTRPMGIRAGGCMGHLGGYRTMPIPPSLPLPLPARDPLNRAIKSDEITEWIDSHIMNDNGVEIRTGRFDTRISDVGILMTLTRYIKAYRGKHFDLMDMPHPEYTEESSEWMKTWSMRSTNRIFQILADAQTQRGDPMGNDADTLRQVRDHVKSLLPHLTADREDIRVAIATLEYPSPDNAARDGVQVYYLIAFIDSATGRALFFHVRRP